MTRQVTWTRELSLIRLTGLIRLVHLIRFHEGIGLTLLLRSTDGEFKDCISRITYSVLRPKTTGAWPSD